MKSSQKTLVNAVIIGIVSLGVIYVGLILFGNWHDEWSGWNAGAYISDGYCNIAVVPVMGDIVTYGEYSDEEGNAYTSTTLSDTMSLLSMAEYDTYIAGVLVLIDSPGGEAVASEMMADELHRISMYMPVAAQILEIGASAGYLVATGADTIFASPFSDVGSIGVTMSYLDYTQQNARDGVEFVSLSSAQFKDSGTPDKPLTAEERALFERDLAIHHETFVKEVAVNRDMPFEQVEALADGSTLPAPLALEAGLIDDIGGKEDVRWWFAQELGLPEEEVVFCQ
jgi:protease-4